MWAKKSSDPCASVFGSSTSVSGTPGSSSGDSKYCSDYPIRKGGMLAPHQKAIAPASEAFVMKKKQEMRARESSDASEFGSATWSAWAPGSVSATDDIDYSRNYSPNHRGASPRRTL